MQWLFIIIALVIATGAGYYMYRIDSKRAVPYPWVTAVLRGLVILLTFLLIIAPDITITKNETKKPVVLLLQDNSRSIAEAVKTDTADFRKQYESLASKLGDKYRVVKWAFGNDAYTDSLYTYNENTTDITAALTKAQEYYGGQNIGAVVLASDGLFNQGVNPTYQNISLPANIYSIGLGDSTLQKDIKVSNVYSNKTVTLNNQFEIRADIIATRCNGYNGKVYLSENGVNIASVNLPVNTDRFDRAVSFSIKATEAGVHHYSISVPATDEEVNTTNNRRDVFVEVVDEQKKILITAAAPHPDINAITSALKDLKSYKITVKTGLALPDNINSYDIIIMHQQPAAARYVQTITKPIWLIAGPLTDIGLVTQINKAVSLNITPAVSQNAFVNYNPAFSYFTLPQNIKAVTEKLPPLSRPQGTVKLMPNAELLFYDKNSNTPIWVLRQGGTPNAYLGGLGLWRWRMYEYKNFKNHNTIDECIRQTISFLSVDNSRKQFSVALPKYVWNDREAINLNAYLLNANNEQVNTTDVSLTIKDSLGNKKEYSFERSGSSYKLNIGIWAGGAYTYTATTKYSGKTLSTSGSFVVESQPIELLETSSDYATLYSLSQKYNGAFFTQQNMSAVYDSIEQNSNIKPVITTDITTVPLIDRKWFFFLILLVVVIEWLLRKYWLAQ